MQTVDDQAAANVYTIFEQDIARSQYDSWRTNIRNFPWFTKMTVKLHVDLILHLVSTSNFEDVIIGEYA